MKKLKKLFFVFIAFIILILISANSYADSLKDGTFDVYHKINSDGVWKYVYSDDKENIDITNVSYFVEDNNLTLTLKVDGVIEDSELIVYYIFYMSEDASYLVKYTNGSGFLYCDNDYDIGANAVVSKNSDDTITGVCSLFGVDTSRQDLYGTAYEYTDVVDLDAELWVDWNPDARSDIVVDVDSGDKNDTSNGIPGFELMVLVFAVLFLFIWKDRRI